MKSRLESPITTANPVEGTEPLSRRDLIRVLALGCAGLLSPGLLAGTAPAARIPGGPVRKGQTLSEEQMRLLRELAETIIPETDTPGAAATDAHGFIDDQLAHCRAPEEARRFIAQLDRLNEQVQRNRGAPFAELSPAARQDAMASIAHNEAPFNGLEPGFFQQLKSLVLLAYYSSEAGATQELVYLPVPGGYRGDFKLSDNGGKAFSPHVF